jgi:hypothetical protein
MKWRERIERAIHVGCFHADDVIAAWSTNHDALAELHLDPADDYAWELRTQIGFAVLGDTPHRALWRLELLERLAREKRAAA